jgi:hypothetical protein
MATLEFARRLLEHDRAKCEEPDERLFDPAAPLSEQRRRE